MITEEFNKVREFLEKMLEKDPNHQGFLDAYIKLIEAKSKFDLETNKAVIEKEMRQSEVAHDLWKTQDTNNANVQMSQAAAYADMQRTFNTNAHQTQQQHNQGMFGLANQYLTNHGT